MQMNIILGSKQIERPRSKSWEPHKNPEMAIGVVVGALESTVSQESRREGSRRRVNIRSFLASDNSLLSTL